MRGDLRPLLVVACLLGGACSASHRSPAGGTADSGAGELGDPSVLPTDPGSGSVCETVGGLVLDTAVVEKLDLLLMVDNTEPLREEQLALQRQLPRLLRVLAGGDADDDGTRDFPPLDDIHIGVVTTDMGLGGVPGIPGCEGVGDDGVMNAAPRPTYPETRSCEESYPRFASYLEGVDDPQQVAIDVQCTTEVGTMGCGFEQPLESVLKALWPASDIDPRTGQPLEPNRIEFLADADGSAPFGHGDGVNAGFLRSDRADGPSLLVVLLVTDEDDCSSRDTRHFTPDAFLPEDDPLRDQDLPLRCFYNPQNLYPLTRYRDGLRWLKPGSEERVIFAPIVAVPTDLVDAAALRGVDFANETEREAFYGRILDDERMQEVPDPNRTEEQGGHVKASCSTDTGRGYPPRRIVELARSFGDAAAVGSTCQSEFAEPIDNLLRVIASKSGTRCLPEAIPRRDDGTIACQVTWDLPPRHEAFVGTPTSCEQRAFLSAPDQGERSARGGSTCRMTQLAVRGQQPAVGEGWYYDDFSETVATRCREGSQRIAYSADAVPPADVVVRLRCDPGTMGPCQ